MRKMTFLQCPSQFYGFRSEIFTIQTFTQTPICVPLCFSRTFSWGLYWSPENGHTPVSVCRRLAPFIPRLHVTVDVPFATAVEKIANITLYSHIASWNPWLGRTTVRLRWTASTCKYCIPVNHTTVLVWSFPVHIYQALPQPSPPSPGLVATIIHKYDISTLHTLAQLR